ncbi:MAG: hypothetical protein ABI440_09575 [Casimicrobiaceae bacterium]
MLTDSHIAKFHRLHATLERFDPTQDREMWIWTAMNAGVHLLNAALHHCGATQEVDSFHSQLQGLYAVPDRASGRLDDSLHPPGDVMHVGQPPITRPLPPALVRACAALKIIEDLREPYVRGSLRPAPGAEREWRAAYDGCVSALASHLGIDTGARA